MRLIDADALIQVLCVNMDTGQQFDRATHCVDEMPTVDAVPVEWIRKYTEENRLYQSDDFDLYISDMIADWMERKEHETD